MIIEKKPIENVRDSGHITLSNLALPQTVKVSFLGTEIIPFSFDIFGHPNFTMEQLKLFRLKQSFVSRNRSKNVPLVAKISYEERIFNKPIDLFDTIEGIKDSLSTLSSFNNLLTDRKLFIKVNPNKKLHEFVVFGSILLDQFGLAHPIKATKEQKDRLICTDIVETYETFKNNNGSVSFFTSEYHIPKEGTICQCCCRKITIKDIEDAPSIYIHGVFYHNECFCNYKRLIKIDVFSRQIMSSVYNPQSYTYEFQTDEYASYSYSPWILFHTIDGDIVLGSNWKPNHIRIEWKKNYAPFEADRIFSNMNISVEENNGSHIVIAPNKKLAIAYLSLVRDSLTHNK